MKVTTDDASVMTKVDTCERFTQIIVSEMKSISLQTEAASENQPAMTESEMDSILMQVKDDKMELCMQLDEKLNENKSL